MHMAIVRRLLERRLPVFEKLLRACVGNRPTGILDEEDNQKPHQHTTNETHPDHLTAPNFAGSLSSRPSVLRFHSWRNDRLQRRYFDGSDRKLARHQMSYPEPTLCV